MLPKRFGWSEKQDCEINAGKRLISSIRETHPKLPLIMTADDLYSKQPFIEHVLSHKMHYVFTVKESDREVLMQYVNGACVLNGVARMEARDKKYLYVYEWINDVPLNGNDDAPSVNHFTLTLYKEDNSWVTDIMIDKKNIEELVRIGRCRWKIENELFVW